MEFEGKRADGGQAYDYVLAAHQSIMAQNKVRCLLPTFWKTGRGKIILHHFVCKGTSKCLIIKFNPEQKTHRRCN